MGGARHDSENKIYVGGLAPETSTESLERHFLKYGDVVDCIVMTDKADNRSRGFGFVTFKDSSAASAAIGTSNLIDGRDVSCKRAVKEGQGSSSDALVSDSGSGTTYNVVKIFVGGLPSSCDYDRLTDHFSRFGRIVDAVVMMDQQTQRTRGFGYVTFDDPVAVESAMKNYSDNKIDGKWVEVKRCIPQDKMRDGGRGRDDRRRDRDGRDSRDSGSSPGHPSPSTAPPQGYPGYDPYGYYARAGDPYGAYAAYYGQYMGYQHPAYAGYAQHPGYGAYGAPPVAGYPPNGAYAAYGYPYGPGGVPPTMPSSQPPTAALPAAPESERSRRRSSSRSRSRSRSRRRRSHSRR